MTLLSIRNVFKSYFLHGKRIDVLRGVSLDIEKGELVSLIGASGAGKSTFLHVLGTLDMPAAGELLFEGRSVFAMNDAEIAVLKALGVSDGGIVKIFLAEGLQIGVAGGLLGLLSGLAWCYFILKVGIKLDPSVYYIPNLPVKIEPVQTALSVVIAVLVTYLASIYPALKASSVEPVEGLKAE